MLQNILESEKTLKQTRTNNKDSNNRLIPWLKSLKTKVYQESMDAGGGR